MPIDQPLRFRVLFDLLFQQLWLSRPGNPVPVTRVTLHGFALFRVWPGGGPLSGISGWSGLFLYGCFFHYAQTHHSGNMNGGRGENGDILSTYTKERLRCL